MTKIERLKLRFASGMSEGRVSDDEWKDEFLPMLEDAERYRWLRDGNGYFPEQNYLRGGKELDAAIDVERTPTKEQQ